MASRENFCRSIAPPVPQIVSSRVHKLRSQRCLVICWRQLISGRSQFSASLIYQLPLILWTTICCCSDSNVSSACMAWRSSGSVHISQAEHSALCMAMWRGSLPMLCARFHKAQSLFSCFLICTYSGFCGPGCQVRRVSSRLCWWFTAVPLPLLSQRNRIVRRPTWALFPGHWPLDVHQQTEAPHW